MFSPIGASVRNDYKESRHFSQMYPKVVNNLLERFVTDQAIANFYTANLEYMQQTDKPPQQYADGLVLKSCKAANAYDKGTLKDVFIEVVDFSVADSY